MEERGLPSEITELDRAIVDLAKSVKVLSNLNWIPTIRDVFLRNWEAQNPKLPVVEYIRPDLSGTADALRALATRAPKTHPIGVYLAKTASSYALGAEMLANIGRPRFTQLSSEIYGVPGNQIFSSSMTHLNAADLFISVTNEYQDICNIPAQDLCYTPGEVAEFLQSRLNSLFTDHTVNVIVDPLLAAKAAAGASRVRVRGSSKFSRAEVEQLVEHECYIHTLTAINGRSQNNLQSLGLGAPRTTRTQEGLALFAELITRTIDLNRLRRIAMRTRAVQMGLDGANFIDVFKFFLTAHFSPNEAFFSTFRVFRGGDVNGGVVFTKDCSYLGGLAEVHTFLRKSIQHGMVDYPHYLCSGRLTLGDIFLLEEQFKSGTISMPRYEPSWITDRPRLTAFLIYSNFINSIPLDRIALDDFKEPSGKL